MFPLGGWVVASVCPADSSHQRLARSVAVFSYSMAVFLCVVCIFPGGPVCPIPLMAAGSRAFQPATALPGCGSLRRWQLRCSHPESEVWLAHAQYGGSFVVRAGAVRRFPFARAQ